MVERGKDELLDHEYDGIREFDNPCPAWWHLIFIGSVVFSGFYLVFFHFGPSAGTNGWTVEQAWEKAYADDLELQFAGVELEGNEATLLQIMKGPDPEAEDAKDWLAIGAAVFKKECKSCHAENGQGYVGPNLTDDNYKNVKTLTDIVQVVQGGAGNGGMPSFQNRLLLNQIVVVSAYVASMRGQNLDGPRGAEGDEIPPWPKEATEPAPEEDGEEAGAPADDQPTDDQSTDQPPTDDQPGTDPEPQAAPEGDEPTSATE